MKKLIFTTLIVIFSFTLFIPKAHAFDQRCWEKSKCIDRRGTSIHFKDQKPEDGFVQNGETIRICGQSKDLGNGKKEEMGFCLPVGKTETKISIGGRRSFSDVADFIGYLYRYSIMAASIISVLIILVAGFQWAISGGNSSTIESARKKINGALMGLTIAVLSYSILTFINPNLVNFRLPEIWLLNTAEILKSDYCVDQGANIKLAKFKDQDEKNVDDAKAQERKLGPYNITPPQAKCGTRYYLQDGGGQFCRGTACDNGEGWICAPASDKSGFDQCYQGEIMGRLFYQPNGLGCSEGWEDFPWVSPGDEKFFGMCKSGVYFRIPTYISRVENEQAKIYTFLMRISGGASGKESARAKVESTCGGTDAEHFKGFFISLSMNEDGDPTDEVHYIGRSPGGTSGMDWGDGEVMAFVAPRVKPEFLFSFEEFEKKGIRLNMNVFEIDDLDDSQQLSLCQAADIRNGNYRDLGIQ